MLNYIVLFGNIKEEPKLTKDKNGEDIIISVPQGTIVRDIPKRDNEEEFDLVIAKLTKGIAERTMEDLHKGDKVGIKGIVKANENKEMEIIVESLTYFSLSKKNENNENETGILER